MKKIIAMINGKKQISPWDNKEYKNLFAKAKLRISRKRAFMLLEILNLALKFEGDVAELGVYKGSTAYLIADCLSLLNRDKKLYLFDTFCGSPLSSKKDVLQRKGTYVDTSEEKVHAFLKDFDSFLEFRKGLIPESCKGLEKNIFCFLHVHLNLYESTHCALDFFYPRMSNFGLVLIEDYGLESCGGVRLAVDEFCKDRSIPFIRLTSGQALMVKINK